jgi:hypothetical protein
MNVEIGAKAALFPGKEYIIGIAVAVQFVTGNNICCVQDWLWADVMLYEHFKGKKN